ncbi:MAG: Rap1a/Tai family immunity protein [Aestuariivita sp.]|nr:Rap1a/Tai family immunity protein [Aestuariivita sp.]
MRLLFVIAILAVGFSLPAQAGSRSILKIHSNYTTAELLSPCQEADNDARWGQVAEIECEQYIIGYVDALEVNGDIGPGTSICLPEKNIPDEIRWAFMRWVHQSYSQRIKMMAGEAIIATLKETFPCDQ